MNAPAPQTLRIHAAAAADHRREWHHPVTAVLQLESPHAAGPVRAARARLVALGHRDLFPENPPPGTHDLDLTADHPTAVLIPGLVNAHAHLDLTSIGPRPHDPAEGFTAWARPIAGERPRDDAAIAAAVRAGVEKSIAGGTVALADIDGSQGRATPHRADLPGTAYTEHFGFTDPAAPPTDPSPSVPDVRTGLSPHAPYSVSMPTFLAAAETGLPLCTHLAESADEREFVLHARGPMRTLLESIGKWNEAAATHLAQGKPPLAWFEPALAAAPGRWLLAHVNDCPIGHVEFLKRHRAHVVYCPRASAYFAAERDFGPHRYRDMLHAGVNVCLGTDSIINLDTPGRISVLDEMRLLRARDGVDAETLFAMATVNGAHALGLDPNGFRFAIGKTLAGLAAVPTPPSTAPPAPPAQPADSPRNAVLDTDSAPIPVLVATPDRAD